MKLKNCKLCGKQPEEGWGQVHQSIGFEYQNYSVYCATDNCETDINIDINPENIPSTSIEDIIKKAWNEVND